MVEILTLLCTTMRAQILNLYDSEGYFIYPLNKKVIPNAGLKRNTAINLIRFLFLSRLKL
jgi:hypothetical protein